MEVSVMSQTSTVYQIRMKPQEKQEMIEFFASMGMKPSQAFRMLYNEAKHIGKMPFTPSVPNKETVEAIEKARKGKELTICKDADDLFDKLGI